MKPSEIKIGMTYRNRNKGTTMRTVLDIGDHIKPPWPTDDKTAVLFSQDGTRRTLSLSSFANWAGSLSG